MTRLSCYGVVDRTNPQAAGVCARGGEVRKLRELQKEMVWRGNRLVWNGHLCCARHIDPPHPQHRVLILPPDPPPVREPRWLRPMLPPYGFVNDGRITLDGFQAASLVTDANGQPITTVPVVRTEGLWISGDGAGGGIMWSRVPPGAALSESGDVALSETGIPVLSEV